MLKGLVLITTYTGSIIFQQSPFLYKVDPYQLQMGYNL